jgi:imidazoleglycerol-phosphate dehydratase
MGAESVRRTVVERATGETRIAVKLNLDGAGEALIQTPVGFLNHLLVLMAKHGLFDFEVKAEGDVEVDDHHTVEDVAITLGRAFGQALGDRRGIVRTGHAYVPMDEALALVAVDIGGRGYVVVETELSGNRLGTMDPDLVRHFLESFALEARMNVHARVLYGANDHHKAEALIKALGRALDSATRVDPRRGQQVPSTKGFIET